MVWGRILSWLLLWISFGHIWLYGRVGYRFISHYRVLVRILGKPLLRRVLDHPPLSLPAPRPGDTCIHILTKSNECLFALWACRSLLERLDRPIPLYVHDDGSLSEADAEMIEAALPGVRLVRRAEADALARGSFEDLPKCMDFRRTHVLGLKLLDPWIVQETGDIVLLDSDVLFFRRPTEMINWLDHPDTRRTRWNRRLPKDHPIDDQPGIGGQDNDRRRTKGFNSGLGFLKRELMNFRTVEDLLSEDRQGANDWLMEQEIYRQLSARGGSEALPATYHVPWDRGMPPQSLVAKHYLGPVRGLFIGEGIWWLLRHPDTDGA